METNKIDKIVRDSLQSRTIKPSSSAWERLNDQLDAAAQPKRINWFRYAGYAASVLLLISVAFFINANDAIEPVIKNDIVTVPVTTPVIDTTQFVKPSFKNTVQTETVIVKAEKKEKKTQKESIVTNKTTELKVPNVVKESSRIVIAANKVVNKKKPTNSRIKIDSDALLSAVTDTKKNEVKSTEIIIPEDSNRLLKPSRIQINSNALLYAVSNPSKDIGEYYKKYNVDRNEVLKNIQKELYKVNLSIDAATLLTSVEKSIDEETFKKSFMQVVKGKITGLASAFANRNN
jgi:hypothetical protein